MLNKITKKDLAEALVEKYNPTAKVLISSLKNHIR